MFRFDEEETPEVFALSDDEEDDKLNPIPTRDRLSIHRRRSSVRRRMSVGSFVSQHSQEVPIKSYDSGSNNVVSTGKQTNIAEFTPLKVLGQGAYGKVVLVKRRSTGQLFAQKELRKASVIVNKQVERTVAERTILAQISNHPNIVKLFYALHDTEKVYLLLEYIPGGELFRHLAQKRVFSEPVAAFYTAQMSLALKHLHELGIVYRDLKPENCLLDSRGFLVLTDFGLSKESEENAGTDFCNSIIGTPEYMAPEVLRGDDYSYSVDWWSLGAVIYDMLTGKPPFTGNNHKTISDKIIKNKVVYPSYLSLYAKNLLTRLLNKNSVKRLGDDRWDELQHERFFKDIDWRKLYHQDPSIVPPIVPEITDPELAENFDHQFTSMKLDSTHNAVDILHNDDYFSGFSYAARESFVNAYMNS